MSKPRLIYLCYVFSLLDFAKTRTIKVAESRKIVSFFNTGDMVSMRITDLSHFVP